MRRVLRWMWEPRKLQFERSVMPVREIGEKNRTKDLGVRILKTLVLSSFNSFISPVLVS